MDNQPQSEQNFGTFNMETKTIYFNGKSYEYTKEELCSDNQSLINALEQFHSNKSHDIFPQGYSYIESLFTCQIESNKKVIIFSNMINKPTTLFYFPLNKYEDLCYSEVYRAKNIEWVKNKFKEYENDNYPQGREYCMKLINENLENDECLCIVTRQDGEKWTRYYFKSKYINIYPSHIRFFQGKTKLESELDIIKKSDENIFPQGIQYCVETVNNQINANGEVYVVESFDPISNKMLWYYLLPDEIMHFCDHIGRHKSDLVEIQRVNDRKLNRSDVIPQGYQFIINFLEELMDCGGIYRIFIKKTKKRNFYFYFGDNK